MFSRLPGWRIRGWAFVCARPAGTGLNGAVPGHSLAEESIYQRAGARTRRTRVTSACSSSRSFCLRCSPPA
jgi:hypothetical protein